MNAMVNELAAEAHANAVTHGFYDAPDSDRNFALMHCELSEAIQAERSDAAMLNHVLDMDEKRVIPEGIAVELADFVIRLLDYAAWQGIKIPVQARIVPLYRDLPRLVNVLHDLVNDIRRADICIVDDKSRAAWTRTEAGIIASIIEHVEMYLDDSEVDLWAVIREKMDYNRTRPRMHGKLY